MIIEIYKAPKTGIFRKITSFTCSWGIIIFAFYFNYKFIDGNNFLDFIIFLITVGTFIGFLLRSMKNTFSQYNDVSDEKIKQIEEILK